MTLQKLKAKWKDEVSNWDVIHLKADDEFMADAENCQEFRDYVLRVRPAMASEKGPRIRFKRPEGIVADKPVKSPVVDPEPIESISKTAQIMKDIKAYRKIKGFI